MTNWFFKSHLCFLPDCVIPSNEEFMKTLYLVFVVEVFGIAAAYVIFKQFLKTPLSLLNIHMLYRTWNLSEDFAEWEKDLSYIY